MFCSNCGHKAGGNFFSECGAKVASAALPVARAIPVALPDWRDEVRYETLTAHPVVRDRIARAAAGAKAGVSGERWLELFDKVAKPVVPLKTIAEVVQPLYARLGIGTGKTRSEAVDGRAGEVLASVLCSLARHGQAVTDAHQADDGCTVEAVLPSDLFALEGRVVVTVHRAGRGTRVEAATKIGGQWFDWGKSTRWLDRFFRELRDDGGRGPSRRAA